MLGINRTSNNRKIRATVDQNVSYKKINNFHLNNLEKKDVNIVLELKYNKMDDDYVRANFSTRNNLRLARNSKFINSIFI